MDIFKKKITVPVLMLVFNRPEKTQQVFDVIRSVKPTKLYVAADAPRDHISSDKNSCSKVREIVSTVDWECDAKYLFHKKNLGCSLAGKAAWDWLFSQEEEMIFLEDDGLVSRSFFGYCQELLERYRHDKRVAYIYGENFGPKYGEASYFFSRFGCGTYSMATWKRVYNLYEYKIETYFKMKSNKNFRNSFISNCEYKYTCLMFENYLMNGGNTYDLQMVYLVHKYNMLNIVPNVNMCTNIGYDFSGTNTSVNPASKIAKKLGNRPRFEISKIVHPDVVQANYKFEKKYLKTRVFYDKNCFFTILRYYISPYMGTIYRLLIKKPLKLSSSLKS